MVKVSASTTISTSSGVTPGIGATTTSASSVSYMFTGTRWTPSRPGSMSVDTIVLPSSSLPPARAIRQRILRGGLVLGGDGRRRVDDANGGRRLVGVGGSHAHDRVDRVVAQLAVDLG